MISAVHSRLLDGEVQFGNATNSSRLASEGIFVSVDRSGRLLASNIKSRLTMQMTSYVNEQDLPGVVKRLSDPTGGIEDVAPLLRPYSEDRESERRYPRSPSRGKGKGREQDQIHRQGDWFL